MELDELKHNTGRETPSLTLEMKSPSSKNLADCASVLQDLRFVQECCQRLAAVLTGPEDQRDGVVLKALWTAALVAYARCFSSGKRLGLQNDDVEDLPFEGVVEFHEWLMGMRNKNLAHSVSPFELVKVGVIVNSAASAPSEVQGVVTLSMQHWFPSVDGVKELGILANALDRVTSEKAQELEKAVLEAARKLTADELAKLPALRTTAPGPDAAWRAR
jgi:hypothetical protein